MAHEWHRGILNESSWHGLEEVGAMADAQAMIDAGYRTGAWPTQIEMVDMMTVGGLQVPGQAVVAGYQNEPRRALAAVGDRYQPTTPAQWADLMSAAVKAGAKPTGAFALRGGTRVLGTFEVGTSNGIRTNLIMVDSFDGSLNLHGGRSDIRVVCANTLSAAMRANGSEWAKVRHTGDMAEKTAALEAAIVKSIEEGSEIKAAYRAAKEMRLAKEDAAQLLAELFPIDPEATGAALTRAENRRRDAVLAIRRPENYEGPTLASIWNASTWLVDRNLDGTARETRSDSALDSMLFGARGQRINEILNVVQVVLRDGTVAPMPLGEFAAREVDMNGGSEGFAGLLGKPRIGQ